MFTLAAAAARPDEVLEMNARALLVAAAGIVFAAGCATTEKQAAVDDDDRVYVTGSRIPVKEGKGHQSVQSTATKQGINDMLRKPGNATGGVGGASGN
jgi:hypothetical protein